MGLHTGEVERQGDHYFGAALYRCARLTNAAHGGQVLLSSATAELVREALPAAADLRDLGEHRLKDLQRPERVFQLVAPGLAADFPALRTLEQFPEQSPGPAHAAHRSRARGRRRRAVSSSTRRRGCSRSPAPVESGRPASAFRSLRTLSASSPTARSSSISAPVISADLVIPSIAKTLSVQEATNRPILDSLREYLRERQLLLVLDNFEHVLAAAAQVADLLSTCPETEGPRHQPGSPAPARRAPVPGAAAVPAGPLARGVGRPADPLRGDPALHRAGAGCQAGLRRLRSRTRTRSPRSATASTACPWPSSSPPRASTSSRLRRCSRGWSTGWPC